MSELDMEDRTKETRQLAKVWYRLTTLFPTTPLIATVSGGVDESEKQYGKVLILRINSVILVVNKDLISIL